jgi:hypothetical protein
VHAIVVAYHVEVTCLPVVNIHAKPTSRAASTEKAEAIIHPDMFALLVQACSSMDEEIKQWIIFNGRKKLSPVVCKARSFRHAMTVSDH